ncbi:uncharacterized protein LOC111077180 [Drosophila obscura]|uniref:uncharacterized protein LOC111077180 n=1 Tax=Drosophila obscura TaxID=7282 RepID=UPI001BB12A10|nr:uncharacterized protein LOC111077180 [Drosophila obscura]
METPNTNVYESVLPHIIAILNCEPRQSTTVDDLCHKVEVTAQTDDVVMRHIRAFETPMTAVSYGIALGTDMGLLAHSNGMVRLVTKLPIRSSSSEQSAVQVEYTDLRRSVEKVEQPRLNKVDEELLFSDENGRQSYSVDEPLIPGQVLRSGRKLGTGMVATCSAPRTIDGPTDGPTNGQTDGTNDGPEQGNSDGDTQNDTVTGADLAPN